MIKYIKKKHKELFNYIPLKLPLILIGIILLSLAVYFFCNKADGFLINLVTELIGIIVTTYLVSYLLFKEERKQWSVVEKIIESKFDGFILSLYHSLAKSINVNLFEEFGTIEYMTKQLEVSELKKIIDARIEKAIKNFTGSELDMLISHIKTEKEQLKEIIQYMEKRPVFIHNIGLFEIENKLEQIINTNFFYKIVRQIKSYIKIIDSNKDYTENFINEIKYILEKLFEIRNNIKSKVKILKKV